MEELQKNSMMAHLLASLEAGKDIGHYGRLVFAMVARHFLTPEELVAMLTKDSDFSESQAKLLVRQVEGKDYNPPKRDRVLAWQKEQEFPICPNPEDPDSCNVYKDLNFPDHVYEHIQDYVEHKAESGS
jgi:DNA primase large subunit